MPHADADEAWEALLQHVSGLCMQSKSRAAESVNIVASCAHTGAPAARAARNIMTHTLC